MKSGGSEVVVGVYGPLMVGVGGSLMVGGFGPLVVMMVGSCGLTKNHEQEGD